ncbi:hypothetical protein TIFTF001_011067 [Ficus carica]|uniref:NAC domain-containing protein n=1 Tax=Ficus carica TaxID=3494 RepID=A0AA87ZZ88_FICCA|nr:hypothetical protein TIFTF001_011067 [Ficus carica]
MDHERSSSHDTDKLDEVMLPGFRFHPTDEELVGFYLKRKIQQRPLSIELIKQLDIYKYDPWDLPSRAAKGVKTDWMMHEFRLPSLADHSAPTKRLDKSFPANDSWAICRIFKKTNSTAQRALSHSWVSPLPEPSSSDILLSKDTNNRSQFSSSANHVCSTNNNIDMQNSSPIDFFPYKFPFHINNLSSTDYFSPNNLIFPPLETPSKLSMDNITPSMLLNMYSILGNNTGHFGNSGSGISSQEQCNNINGFSNALPFDHVLQGNLGSISAHIPTANATTSSDRSSEDHEWEAAVRSLGFPLNLPLPLSTVVADPWKPSMIWDSNLPCPTEMSTNFPTNKCYT